MKTALSIIAFAVLLFPSGNIALCQEDLEKRLEKLETDYEILKRKLKASLREGGFDDFLSRIHFHGYGEVHYNNPKTNSAVSRGNREWDVHRLVLGWGYEFTDNIRFDTEIDFEHAADEIELEYAQLEMDLLPNLSFRAGSLLMPVGPLNEFHEPPTFYSVERPETQNSIIPTTWQEIGAGFAGQAAEGKLAYRAYVVSGLEAENFSTSTGIRGGRSKGARAKTNDLAFVGRLEYSVIPELLLGGSAYYGGADQDADGLGRVTLGIYEVDAKLRIEEVELMGLFTLVDLGNADNISALTGDTIGETMQGWYAEAAYHLGRKFWPDSEQDVILFARREELDTNKGVPAGFTKDPTAKRNIWTFGLAYYPIPQVALKADYERWRDDASNRLGRFNFGIAWMF